MRTPTRLLLARHGETDWNRSGRYQGQTDIELNGTGVRQAEALAARLRSWSIDAVVGSDLRRAARTAAILGAALEREPRLDPAWRELHLGELEGHPVGHLPGDVQEIISHVARSGRPVAPGGETYARFEQRLLEGYRTLCREHAGETVLLVGHGGALKALIAHLIGLDPRNVLHLSLRGNTSLSIVDYRWGRPQLLLLNCTAHLDGADE